MDIVNEISKSIIKASTRLSDDKLKALKKAIDLESKLKTAYMAYRVAEAVWTQLNDNSNNLKACKARAGKLIGIRKEKDMFPNSRRTYPFLVCYAVTPEPL